MPTVIMENEQYLKPKSQLSKTIVIIISTDIKVSNVKELYLDVNHLENWTIISIDTPVKAKEKVINENEYIIPTITIETKYNSRYFA